MRKKFIYLSCVIFISYIVANDISYYKIHTSKQLKLPNAKWVETKALVEDVVDIYGQKRQPNRALAALKPSKGLTYQPVIIPRSPFLGTIKSKNDTITIKYNKNTTSGPKVDTVYLATETELFKTETLPKIIKLVGLLVFGIMIFREKEKAKS